MRIVSDSPYYLRRVFPYLWFGGMLAIASMIFLEEQLSNDGAVAAIVVGITGFVVARKLASYLMDEVKDDEESLFFRRGDLEQRVYLRDIRKIRSNNAWITVLTSTKGVMGKRLSFVLPSRFFHFSKHPYFIELKERVENARNT